MERHRVKGAEMTITKRGLIVLVVLLVGLAAMPAALAGGDQERPFKQDLEGQFLGMVTDPAELESRCGEGALWISHMAGHGTITHLGRVTWTTSHCFYEDFTFSDANLVITAANGDELRATYAGYMTGETTWAETLTVLGGTGRFEGASGSSSNTGWIDMASGHMETNGTGWITYHAGH
jgi:hypothetical protein